jgi:ribosomal protein S1
LEWTKNNKDKVVAETVTVKVAMLQEETVSLSTRTANRKPAKESKTYINLKKNVTA